MSILVEYFSFDCPKEFFIISLFFLSLIVFCCLDSKHALKFFTVVVPVVAAKKRQLKKLLNCLAGLYGFLFYCCNCK